MQAALPMYFPPREALQAFWAALAERLRTDPALPSGIDIPAELAWPADVHAHWLEPELLLGQACGYPLTTFLAGKVQLVGSFAYDAPGVQGVDCHSQLICRACDTRNTLEAFADGTLAYNDTVSQSGYNALRALLASPEVARPFFAATVETGAHYQSIEAVRRGQADMAAIDAVSWAHWQRSQPKLASELKVFGQTGAYPGLPLITALQTPPDLLAALRNSLQAVATGPAYAALRAPLLVNGFVVSTLADYQVCITMQDAAYSGGLRQL
jgi:ABC-type phosphate/phosphonate transport system substrate-binding protein